MTTSDHVYILTATDSDGDHWIVNVCNTLEIAQLAREQFADVLVYAGMFPDIDTAIDNRQLRIAFHRIEDRAAIEKQYSKR